jgi:hypothetical protein
MVVRAHRHPIIRQHLASAKLGVGKTGRRQNWASAKLGVGNNGRRQQRASSTGRNIMKKSSGLSGLAAVALTCVALTAAGAGANAAGNVTVRSAPAYRAPVVTRTVTASPRGPVIVNRSHGRPHHHRSRPGVFIAAPIIIGSCASLRIKAIDTGAKYWWHRYRECRGWE